MADHVVDGGSSAAPRVGHPLADWVGAGLDGTSWVATESRGRVIGFTRMRANLLATALAEGRRPLLITDELSVLTPAFARIWQQGGGSWTVRTTSGGLYDGFNGARIQTAEDTWTTALPSTPDAIADEFCAAGSSAGVTLISSVRLRHSAREETLLGRPVESWSEGPFGAAPVAWDTHEPIGRRWDRAALTEALREEMPGPATVIVGGPSLSATITAERTDLGVEEEDVIEMGLAGSTADDLGLLRDQQADVLRQLAESAMPVVAVQMIRPGGQELTIPPSLRPPPIPLLLLLGPPTVRELGIDVSAMSDRFGAEQVGRPRLPSLLFTFGSVTEAWDRVAEVLAAIDHRGELSQALFTPSAPEEARHG